MPIPAIVIKHVNNDLDIPLYSKVKQLLCSLGLWYRGVRSDKLHKMGILSLAKPDSASIKKSTCLFGENRKSQRCEFYTNV